MKTKLSIIALVAIVAATSGLVGSTFSTSEEVNQATSFVTSPLITGHLTVEARDSDGNLKAVRTSDNAIVRNGEDCVAKALFGAGNLGTASLGYCRGAVTQPFTYIELGSGTTQEQAGDNALQTPTAVSGLVLASVGGGTISSWTNSTGAVSNGAIIVVSKTFTAGSAATISEAGLFNGSSSSTNGMFAHKVFAPITLATNDQLTVQWTITLGNTTSFK